MSQSPNPNHDLTLLLKAAKYACEEESAFEGDALCLIKQTCEVETKLVTAFSNLKLSCADESGQAAQVAQGLDDPELESLLQETLQQGAQKLGKPESSEDETMALC
jgi:hypothetical protein